MKWKELKYWTSGEYQVVQERLNDLSKAKRPWNPGKRTLFRAMDLLPFEEVKVMFCAQDPYPDPIYCTGCAFDIPADTMGNFPPTLSNLIKEYHDDTGFPIPVTSGSLLKWVEQGVFLWNCIPSCTAFKSLSHDWPEWELLTQEIIRELSKQSKTVFVFFGGRARRYAEYVEPGEDVIEVSHPSPRASRSSKHPFLGSRIFTTVNAKLVGQGLEPINWRL
jgi:uracil-DNA glycosylase